MMVKNIFVRVLITNQLYVANPHFYSFNYFKLFLKLDDSYSGVKSTI